MSTLRDLNAILNPRKLKAVEQQAVGGYGNEALERICVKFSQPEIPDQVGFQVERAKADFYMYKMHARTCPIIELSAFAEQLLCDYNEIYPDYCILMQYFLSVPLNSASCERGFSAQNILKTKSRNRLSTDRLNKMLRVSINGPHWAEFDYTDAAQNFRAIRNRRK